ncbi:MAG: HypC/HybG/HupF family hydrogenase formation chaperone [Thermodesulfobacteriota bacterium]
MCLAMPCKVVEIDGEYAVVESSGHTLRVETALLRNKTIDKGDYLLVHDGLAIGVLPTDDARAILKMIDTLADIPGAH